MTRRPDYELYRATDLPVPPTLPEQRHAAVCYAAEVALEQGWAYDDDLGLRDVVEMLGGRG